MKSSILITIALTIQSLFAQNWVEIIPDSGEMPLPRTNAVAIYDSAAHRMVVFGGRSASGDLNDIWEFDLTTNSWQALMPTDGPTPTPRRTAGSAYDPANHQMLIWMGQGSGLYNDVWAFDLSQETWTEFSPPDPKPNTRYGVAGIFDPLAGEVVNFAGFTSNGRFDDTWRFNPAIPEWRDVTPASGSPLRRCLHSASYDSRDHRMIMYGGTNSGGLNDIWAFDLNQDTWIELTPADSPEGRFFPTNIYDSRNHRALIFGGFVRSGSRTNDVWAFDLTANTWQQLIPSGDLPVARDGAVGVYIEDEDRMVIFSGQGGSRLNDVWSLENLSQPTAIETPGEASVPTVFELFQNFPNPFNPSTTIRYNLGKSTVVSLKIYNLLGQEIRVLVNETQSAGQQSVTWNGRNNFGAPVVSGIYLYRIETENFTASRKLVLIQ